MRVSVKGGPEEGVSTVGALMDVQTGGFQLARACCTAPGYYGSGGLVGPGYCGQTCGWGIKTNEP